MSQGSLRYEKIAELQIILSTNYPFLSYYSWVRGFFFDRGSFYKNPPHFSLASSTTALHYVVSCMKQDLIHLFVMAQS